MLFKVILVRTIEQSTPVLEILAGNIEEAKVTAERRHREGLEWNDDSVEYGKHEIHGDGKDQRFIFDD